MTERMQELAGILRSHAAAYPAMEPTDAVKLIYQNEFGGGHLIRDRESCLHYLHREYTATPKCETQTLLEDIGNGLVRVHLAALPEQRVDELGAAFLRSAADQQGSGECFRRKMALLRSLCAEGIFSFDTPTLDAYLTQYEQAGFPAVSHSKGYRNAYHPSYRIVKKVYFMNE